MKLASGRYELDETLGQGGAATVYRATDTLLGVSRAIKILTAGGRGRDAMRLRMQAEAKTMAQLGHPNILQIFDVGQEDDVDYVVMSLAEGSLADMLDAQGPLSPAHALRYTVQILAALAAAHSEGIVHRDVKPHNVLLSADGTALLADFGIALIADDLHRGTRTGVAMGSVAFMPPEQRLDAKSVGPTADIYATGATLYNLITAANPVDLFAVKPHSPRWKGVSPDIVSIIRRATQLEPGDRYLDARTMAEDVLVALKDAGEVALSRPDPENPQAFPSPSDRFSQPSSAPNLPGAPSGSATEAAATYITDLGELPAYEAESSAPQPVTFPPKGRRRLWALGGLLLLTAGMVLLGVWYTQSGERLRPVAAPDPQEADIEPGPTSPQPAPAPDPAPAAVPDPTPAPDPTRMDSPRPIPVPVVQPRPRPAMRPQPAPDPQPSATPAPAPEPEAAPEAAPAPAPAVGGFIRASGDKAEVWVKGDAGTFALDATVPAGQYTVMARFGGARSVRAGKLTVEDGQDVVLKCDQSLSRCSVD